MHISTLPSLMMAAMTGTVIAFGSDGIQTCANSKEYHKWMLNGEQTDSNWYDISWLTFESKDKVKYLKR